MQIKKTHTIADLFNCDLGGFAPEENSVSRIKQFISGLLSEQRLRELGSYYHFFSPGAVTAVVCLAESHLTFHSWPEKQYVSFDIFLCNQALDTKEISETILCELNNAFFHSLDIKLTPIAR